MRATATPDSGQVVTPRDLGDAADDDNGSAGFLYISTTEPWPSDTEDVLQRLPAEWLDEQGNLRPDRSSNVPALVSVSAQGELGANGIDARWVPSPFPFSVSRAACRTRVGLAVTSVALAPLVRQGRSTATTIMSLAAIKHLREAIDLPERAKKLLSFTDNRQDASLQAGHFNDFVQVTLLRSALFNAASGAGPDGLFYDELHKRVFDALALPFEEYALEPDLRGAAKLDTERAMQGVLSYRLYQDLERGWRLNQPNLDKLACCISNMSRWLIWPVIVRSGVILTKRSPLRPRSRGSLYSECCST